MPQAIDQVKAFLLGNPQKGSVLTRIDYLRQSDFYLTDIIRAEKWCKGTSESSIRTKNIDKYLKHFGKDSIYEKFKALIEKDHLSKHGLTITEFEKFLGYTSKGALNAVMSGRVKDVKIEIACKGLDYFQVEAITPEHEEIPKENVKIDWKNISSSQVKAMMKRKTAERIKTENLSPEVQEYLRLMEREMDILKNENISLKAKYSELKEQVKNLVKGDS